MRQTLRSILLAGLALSLAGGAARAAEFSAYEGIIVRQPFGSPAADKAATEQVSEAPPPEAFVLGYKLTAITRDEDGVVHVGIVDQKNKKSYLLAHGDKEDELFIGGVEIEFGEAQLCKGTEKYWMTLLTGNVASNRAARLAAATNKAPVKLPVAMLPTTAAPPAAAAAFLPPRPHRLPAPALTNLSYVARKQLRDDLHRRALEAQQLAAVDKPPASGTAIAPTNTPPMAEPAEDDLQALLSAAGATNRASLVALLNQIGFTNADAVVESEPVE